MRSLKLSGLIRRNPDRPSLKQRAAALRATAARVLRRPSPEADQGRRVMMAGSLAAVLPLPALAAPASVGTHPDQALLDVYAKLIQARVIEAAADDAYNLAWRTVLNALEACPDEIRPTEWEYNSVNSSPFRPVWGVWMRFHYVPALDEDDHRSHVRAAWTGKALRKVIALAVPVLGWGGQTPHRIRRWKAILSTADAFDAQVAAAEEASDYHRRDRERDAARKVVAGLTAEVSRSVAITPAGMATLVSVVAEYSWKDTGGAWPNLLRSAANVSGVPLADLEHEYASTRLLCGAEA